MNGQIDFDYLAFKRQLVKHQTDLAAIVTAVETLMEKFEDVWDEGFNAGYEYIESTPSGIFVDPPMNPYRRVEANRSVEARRKDADKSELSNDPLDERDHRDRVNTQGELLKRHGYEHWHIDYGRSCGCNPNDDGWSLEDWNTYYGPLKFAETHEHQWTYDRSICFFCNGNHGYCDMCGETEPCDPVPAPEEATYKSNDPLDERDHRDRVFQKDGGTLSRCVMGKWHWDAIGDSDHLKDESCWGSTLAEWAEDEPFMFKDNDPEPLDENDHRDRIYGDYRRKLTRCSYGKWHSAYIGHEGHNGADECTGSTLENWGRYFKIKFADDVYPMNENDKSDRFLGDGKRLRWEHDNHWCTTKGCLDNPIVDMSLKAWAKMNGPISFAPPEREEGVYV